LFDERGTSLIGKPAEKLLKHHTKNDIPPEINTLVGEKLTVIVKIMAGKSLEKPDGDPTFDIVNIKKRHGKDLMMTTFKGAETETVISAGSSQSVNLPPLVPIAPKQEANQVSYVAITYIPLLPICHLMVITIYMCLVCTAFSFPPCFTI
jgi:replication factor A1